MKSEDELKTNVPSIADLLTASMELGNAYPYNNYNYSDVRVAKGDFIRLKSISFAYDVPSQKPFLQERLDPRDGQRPLVALL